jgi:glyoxylase-like metal-dependent hydrolase (beta-lactamase superfamily II)
VGGAAPRGSGQHGSCGSDHDRRPQGNRYRGNIRLAEEITATALASNANEIPDIETRFDRLDGCSPSFASKFGVLRRRTRSNKEITMTSDLYAELSRRNIMTLGASVGIGLGVGSISTSALAKAAKLRGQAPYWYRFNIGEAEITVVSDGWQMLGDPSNSFLGEPKDEVRKELTDNFMNPSDMNIELNSFVVNSNGKMVPFDTGLGASKMFGPKGGLLARSLSDAGIKREDIDADVISHGHIDHIGGIVDESGALMYPNAQVYMSQADFDYWTNQRQMDSPWKKAFIIHARKNLLPVRDRLIFFKDEQEFLPGITAIAALGHTLGHTMFNVQSNGQSFFYVGDVSHHSVLLIESPRMEFLYDTDAKQAVKTRLKMLSFLAENRIPILAYHFAWPGYGHFREAGRRISLSPRRHEHEPLAGCTRWESRSENGLCRARRNPRPYRDHRA